MIQGHAIEPPQVLKDFGVSAIRPYGPQALILVFADDNDRKLDLIHPLASHWLKHPIPNLLNVVPASDSITLIFEHDVDLKAVTHAAERASKLGLEPITPQHHEVPISYDQAPDIHAVCDALDLTVAQFQQLHSETLYRADMLGFIPGFAYLSGLPATLRMPRKATPRTHVPPGSVAIAEQYCAIYPLDSPGGWHLIGHTELPLLDWQREPFCPIKPSDTVRFIPT